MKVVAIRADASVKIGTGHVMRCLVLAEQIRKGVSNVEIVFLCVGGEGNLIEHIQGLGYPVVEMGAYDDVVTAEQLAANISTCLPLQRSFPVDLLIVDHYQLDCIWEKAMRTMAKRILVIDDLANREHDCDALLDQNYNENMEERYKKRVPDECQCFVGPRHLLLRPEFLQAREIWGRQRQRSEPGNRWQHREGKNNYRDYRQQRIENLLIFYGGSDPTGETLKALQAVALWKSRSGYHQGAGQRVHVRVIAGASNPALAGITAYCHAQEDVQVHRHVENMAELLTAADLVLGAGGVSMWERCYLGIPSIVTVVAENQRTTTELAAGYGAIWSAGWHGNVSIEDLAVLLARADQDFGARCHMSERAVLMMDEGVGERRLLDWVLDENIIRMYMEDDRG